MDNKIRLVVKVAVLIAIEIVVFFVASLLAHASGALHISPLVSVSLGIAITIAYNIVFDTFIRDTQRKLDGRLHLVEMDNQKLRRDFEKLKVEVLTSDIDRGSTR